MFNLPICFFYCLEKLIRLLVFFSSRGIQGQLFRGKNYTFIRAMFFGRICPYISWGKPLEFSSIIHLLWATSQTLWLMSDMSLPPTSEK